MNKMTSYLLPVVWLCTLVGSMNVSAAAKPIEADADTSSRESTSFLFDMVDHVIQPKQDSVDKANIEQLDEALNKANYAGRKLRPYRMAGPSSLFRRVVNAPGAGGSRYTASREAPEVGNKQTVTLKAKLPAGFRLNSVQWLIKSTNGAVAKRAKGSGSKVILPPGKYSITMKVDKSSVTKKVTVSGAPKTVSFALKAGRLKASATFSGGVKDKVSFDVYSIKNGKRQSKVYSVKRAYSISQALPPGDYEVVTKYKSNTSAKKRITVQAGKTKVAKLILPATTVKLMAKDANAQPYMGKTSWQIFRADSNKLVKTASLHTAKVKLPAGRYLVKGKAENGSWKMKKVTVTPGATKYVKLQVK